MGLTKAKLEIEREVGKSVIEVLFNPSEYQLTDGSSYSEKKIPGLDGPIIQYISGDATELSLSLFLDTYVPKSTSLISFGPPKESTDVSIITKQIADATSIDGSMHRPPKVTFKWGSLNFEGLSGSNIESRSLFFTNRWFLRRILNLRTRSIKSLLINHR